MSSRRVLWAEETRYAVVDLMQGRRYVSKEQFSHNFGRQGGLGEEQMNQPDEGTAVGRLHAKDIKLVLIQMASRLSRRTGIGGRVWGSQSFRGM